MTTDPPPRYPGIAPSPIAFHTMQMRVSTSQFSREESRQPELSTVMAPGGLFGIPSGFGFAFRPIACSPHSMDSPRVPPSPFSTAALRTRVLTPEWMDDPMLPPELHRKALRGLGRLHGLSRMGAGIAAAFQPRLTMLPQGATILDVGTGRGDLLAEVVARTNAGLSGHGIDLSHFALSEAKEKWGPKGLKFHLGDCLASEDPAPVSVDFIMCSLLFHHLEVDQVVGLLSRMNQRARRFVVVADLRRSLLAWWAVRAGAALLTRSPVVRVDSDLSVRAAFTMEEVRAMCDRAGIPNASLHRCGPAGWLLSFEPTGKAAPA
mgnify:CR=1 FL=1